MNSGPIGEPSLQPQSRLFLGQVLACKHCGHKKGPYEHLVPRWWCHLWFWKVADLLEVVHHWVPYSLGHFQLSGNSGLLKKTSLAFPAYFCSSCHRLRAVLDSLIKSTYKRKDLPHQVMVVHTFNPVLGRQTQKDRCVYNS